MADLGDAVTLAVSPRDVSDNSVDVESLALRVIAPDGTIEGPFAPTRDGFGEYSYVYTPTQAGRHFVAWSGTGWAGSDVLNVWPADPRFLFSLDDAKRALRRPVEWSKDDEDLRLYIAATTAVIEDIVGPVVPTASRTKTFPAGASAVLLDAFDATVTAVTVDGVTATADTDYRVSSESGVVYALATNGDGRFRYAGTVTYTVGSGLVPPNIILAAREEFRFLWQIGQQGARPTFGDAGLADEFTPSGFAVPRRVIELCGSRRKAYTPA